MKAGWLFFVGLGTACTSAVVDDYRPSPADSAVPAAEDGGLDAAEEQAPCSDCEYFPETCAPSVFCPNGPFEPGTAGGALDPRTAITVVRGRSANDVWAAGSVGAAAHFDGTSWTRSDTGSLESIRALWLGESAEVAVGVAFPHVLTRGVAVPDGGAASSGGWSNYVLPPPDMYFYYTLITGAGAAPGSSWLWFGARYQSVWRLRGAAEGLKLEQVFSGFANGECQNAHAVCNFYGVHGASADQIWLVGARGETARVMDAESAAPRLQAFNSQTPNALNAVWAASATEAWSVGGRGTIRHYTGDPIFWDIVSDVPTDLDLNGVWGFSSTDVWAVGDLGVVLHYDGERWSRVQVAGLGVDRPNLLTVWGADPGHVWIGGQGLILSLGGKP